MVIAQKLTAMVALAALLAAGFVATAPTASAFWFGGDDVEVSNSNSAKVINKTEADASTGGNYAGGSEGGNGGNGGDIENDDGDDQEVDDSSTGNGGAGGDASWGGSVTTGNAVATAGTANFVNKNDTRVNRCGCDGDDRGDTKVRNRNEAFLYNKTEADARTGRNAAGGSDGGNGGNGGDIENDDGDDQDVEESTTGHGGRGGNGSDGGVVVSGHADSDARTVNVVNRNMTRIVR